MKQLQIWWKTLPQRDRRLLAAWLLCMALGGVIWLWILLAAAQEKAQHQFTTELNTLSMMRVQAEELQRLKQLPEGDNKLRSAAALAVIESLEKFGMSSNIIQTNDAGSPTEIILQGKVPFDKWVEWLVFVQTDMHIVLQKAKITRADLAGMADIQVTLEKPAP